MNLRAIDLNLLPVLEALVEERHVTRAARRLGLSQPAMSNALARLRRTFDDPLLVRTPEGMVPTPAAQSLMVAVRAALGQLRAALEERPQFDPAASRRAFQILANDYVEIMLLAPLLGQLRAAARGIGLRIQRPRSVFEPPPAGALADTFDLAIGFFPEAPALAEGIRSALLWEERNVCLARAGHPSVRGRLTLAQYAAAEHVAIFYKAQGPGLIDTLLAQKGYTRRPAVLVPHFASVPFVVAGSDLIATVPERLAREFGRLLPLQILRAPLAIPPFRLAMIWHERREADPAHLWLRNFITGTSVS